MNPVKYSISDLEKLSGIRAHTIRIWEKRYGIIQPERTNTNIRYYSDIDLQKLLNISILNKNGFKISQISDMSRDEIIHEVTQIAEGKNLVDADINSMVMSAIQLKEDHFDRVLNACLLKYGFENTFCDVIFPLFEKVGLLWQIGRINACQERFITNLVRQKLLVAIDGLIGTNENNETFLLLMPDDDFQEIGLLYSNYLIRKKGFHVVYLGPSVPLDHLRKLQDKEQFHHILLHSSLLISDVDLSKYLVQLKEIFPTQNIHITSLQPRPDWDKLKQEKVAIHSSFDSFATHLG